MAILVDCVPVRHGGRTWYHMTSDESIEELQAFARRLGLKRSWMHTDGDLPRYAVVDRVRDEALRRGARKAGCREILAAGRRLSKQWMPVYT